MLQGSGLYIRRAAELESSFSWRERHRTALLRPESAGNAHTGQLACRAHTHTHVIGPLNDLRWRQLVMTSQPVTVGSAGDGGAARLQQNHL